MILLNNVSKKFKLPVERRNTLFEEIVSFLSGKRNFVEFWALKNVTLSIHKGEIFGIMGLNGSGKSTLLKIIAGVLYPDSGEVKVKGKVTPILELGVGFNPELTAKENVYVYGVIMGMKKDEIKMKFDKIFKFAELEKFKNMKLKNFSSGMYARLAFATAIFTEPDILLIDEVLAVGDINFQRKCIEKIKELNENGTTIVIVSHSPEMIAEMCDRVMVLENGVVKMIGDAGKAIEAMLNDQTANISHLGGSR
ncbi:MAG: ABC transporter ATP-binding protein [Archaeoglobaceae archaeon]|nr:ABC transporter ATP-binding protein [Archaeoglobaceae archaeon]